MMFKQEKRSLKRKKILKKSDQVKNFPNLFLLVVLRREAVQKFEVYIQKK